MVWLKFKAACGFADKLIYHAGGAMIIFGGAMIALTVILQVLLRYVFKSPLFGLEEFSRFIAVWVYFIGAIFGTRNDAHVQGDVVMSFMTDERKKSWIKTITWVLCLILCSLFLYHTWKYCAWLYGTGERTTGLWWPRITSVASMLFGAAFMTLYCVANLIKNLETALQRTFPRLTRGGLS